MRRLYFLLAIGFILFGITFYRLFSLQVLQYEYYHALAQNQHELKRELLPARGTIFIRDIAAKNTGETDIYSPLVVDKEFYRVYLVPKKITEEERGPLAQRLSKILDLDEKTIIERMSKPNDPYEPLKNKVVSSQLEEVKKIENKGIGFQPETKRYYPYKELASHITGFVRADDNKIMGQYGLERRYQEELSGKAGIISGGKDTDGYHIPSLTSEFRAASDGQDLFLTLDENIQFKAKEELKHVIEKYDAEKGTIIVMQPETGAILAMANYPAFDPNKYNEVEDIGLFINPAVQEVYEPGSVFKPLTMAAGIDTGVVTPQTTYQDKGAIGIRNTVIKNVDGKAYGEQTMVEVLEKSLNTGAVFVQQELGVEKFRDYVQRFRFGEPTGVDLPGEVGGNIFNLFTGREINLANISFGQGITVTPLNLISAISAIANDGKLMRPYLVDKMVNPSGRETKTKPALRDQVIDKTTADKVTKMMVSVTENGFGKPAKVEGYNIAGKTGTAQVPDSEKGGYSEDTIHTFVGFAPAFNPEFAILIKLDKPKGVRFASESVAPIFKSLAGYLFNYLEIPPQNH